MAEPQAEQWTATDPVYLNRAHQTHRHPNLGGRGLRAHDGRRAQVAGRAHRGVASDPQSRAGPGRHRLPGRQRPSPRPGASRRAGAGCSGRGGRRTGCPVPRGPLPGELRPLAAVGHPRSLPPRWASELAAALLLRCRGRAWTGAWSAWWSARIRRWPRSSPTTGALPGTARPQATATWWSRHPRRPHPAMTCAISGPARSRVPRDLGYRVASRDEPCTPWRRSPRWLSAARELDPRERRDAAGAA